MKKYVLNSIYWFKCKQVIVVGNFKVFPLKFSKKVEKLRSITPSKSLNWPGVRSIGLL